MAEINVGEVLRIIQYGWPATLNEEELQKLFSSLSESYGVEKENIAINVYQYPLPGATQSNNGVTEWLNLSTGQWQTTWEFVGKRYSIKLDSGERELAVVTGNDGNVIRREYIDSGNYHAVQIAKFIKSWPKAAEQAQRGGRRKGARTKETKTKFEKMLKLRGSIRWRFRSDKEFLEGNPEYSRSSLQRAKLWDSKGRP